MQLSFWLTKDDFWSYEVDTPDNQLICTQISALRCFRDDYQDWNHLSSEKSYKVKQVMKQKNEIQCK